MSGSNVRSRFVDLAPLRSSPAYARLFTGQSVSAIGTQLTVVAVGLNVYALTHSTFAVSLVGVVALVPTIAAGLYGGMIADAFDRRRVALIAAAVSWASTLTLAALSWTRTESLLSLYLLTALTAVAATVLQATQSAMLPRLIGIRLLPAASALNGITQGIAVTVGPALAGVLVATVGFQWCYSTDATLFVAALIGIISLPSMPHEGQVDRPGLASLKAGVGFLRRAPNIRAGFLIDIAAMTFGQPRTLAPAAGALLLGGGALTVGALYAATAIGALLCSLLSGRLGDVRLQGRAIARSVEVYGACIVGFGLVLVATTLARAAGARIGGGLAGMDVPAVLIAALFLAGAGAADNVSAIFRSTMMQAAAPDSVRGRLQGVFIVVVTGGPRIGDLYVGLLTLAFGVLWPPPVLGGLLVIVVAAVFARRRHFRDYDALHPTP